MNAAQIIQLALGLTQLVLEQIKTKSDVPSEIVADVQAAFDALQKVHGTPVTFEQLESLRTKPTF